MQNVKYIICHGLWYHYSEYIAIIDMAAVSALKQPCFSLLLSRLFVELASVGKLNTDELGLGLVLERLGVRVRFRFKIELGLGLELELGLGLELGLELGLGLALELGLEL